MISSGRMERSRQEKPGRTERATRPSSSGVAAGSKETVRWVFLSTGAPVAVRESTTSMRRNTSIMWWS